MHFNNKYFTNICAQNNNFIFRLEVSQSTLFIALLDMQYRAEVFRHFLFLCVQGFWKLWTNIPIRDVIMFSKLVAHLGQ